MTLSQLEAVRQETHLLSHHHQIFKPTCVCIHLFLHHFCQNENTILVPVRSKAFIHAPYPIPAHLPLGLWYYSYPNTTPIPSSPSYLFNPFYQ